MGSQPKVNVGIVLILTLFCAGSLFGVRQAWYLPGLSSAGQAINPRVV